MRKLLLAGTTLLLMATSADATLYDRYGRVYPVRGYWINHRNGTTSHFNDNGVLIGRSIRRGNITTVYSPTGKLYGHRP